MEKEVFLWLLGGFALVLGFLATIIFRQTSQLAVLQKTVDQMVVKFDLFIKSEKDAFKEIVTQNTQALKDLAK